MESERAEPIFWNEDFINALYEKDKRSISMYKTNVIFCH